MINGAHFIIFSKDAETDRAFLGDVLGFRSVDAGRGWLIFALPASEMAVHPADDNFTQPDGDHPLFGTVPYLMCDDLRSTMKTMQAKKVKFSSVEEAPWGTVTTFRLPSGGELGLYQPKHPTALGLR